MLDLARKNYFLAYQLRWINDDSPFKLYEKSRRIGITYATSYRCFRKCMQQPEGSTFIQWVSSRDDLTAKEFIRDYVAMWAKAANVVASGLAGDRVEVVDEKRGVTAFVVEFANGARIVSLSSNPLAFAGKGGDVLLDEIDLHKDQTTLVAMAYPCIMWGGQLEIVSAYDPAGSEHTEFAHLCQEAKNGNPKKLSFYSTTLDDAIADGLCEKINEVKLRRGKPTQTRAEFREQTMRGCISQSARDTQYFCKPNMASGDRTITSADLTAAKKEYHITRIHLVGDAGPSDTVDPSCQPYTEAKYWRALLPEKARLALGYDVARTTDLAAIFINLDLEKVYYLQVSITLKNCKYESQKLIIDAILTACRRAIGVGDATGMGGTNCEWLTTKYGERFKGVNFSAYKLVLGQTMVGVYEQHRQIIPHDPPEIAADVEALRNGATPTGRLTYRETANPLLADSHCDIAWSNAMAIYAGETIDAGGPCAFAPAVAERGDADAFLQAVEDDDNEKFNERRNW